MRASSPQRIHLKVHARGGAPGKERASRVVFHPYPGVWLRAAIPVSMLARPPATGHDMAAVGNRSRSGYFLSLWGPFVPLTDVEAIGFEMEHPIGSPTLEVRSVRLENTSPGDAVLDGLPVLDELGQYAHGTWRGKAGSADDLQKAWRDEERTLAAGDFGFCRYGGFAATKADASGFFRVERRDGRWWFVDPDGHLFLSLGADVIQPEMTTPAAGRDGFFRERPPAAVLPARERGGDRGVSFFTWNLLRRFGEGWRSAWIDHTLRRMDAWGLNTVANWSNDRLVGGETEALRHPARELDRRRELPGPAGRLLGGLREEGRRARATAVRAAEGRPLAPRLLPRQRAALPAEGAPDRRAHPRRPRRPPRSAALQKWLAAGDTEERRKEFVGDAFDRYVSIASAAVKRHDPNHLNLGMRSGGQPTAAEVRAARAFDVYSVNIYDYEVPVARVRQIAQLTGKPILIGEFHFGTPGRGLAASLVQVRDQAERGKAYRYYVENAFAMPELVGTHYFQWADQPATGRFDGENYNIGLVDVDGPALPGPRGRACRDAPARAAAARGRDRARSARSPRRTDPRGARRLVDSVQGGSDATRVDAAGPRLARGATLRGLTRNSTRPSRRRRPSSRRGRTPRLSRSSRRLSRRPRATRRRRSR